MSYLLNEALFGKDYAKHNSRKQIEKQKTQRAELRKKISTDKAREQRQERQRRESEIERKEEEREARIEQREELKEEKLRQKEIEEAKKQQQLVENKDEVEAFNQYITQIQAVHKVASESIDWQEIRQEEAPHKVEGEIENTIWQAIKQEGQEAILKQIEEFKPSIYKVYFDMVFKKNIESLWVKKVNNILFKQDKDKLQILKDNYEKAGEIDKQKFEALKLSQIEAYKSWLFLQEIAKDMVAKKTAVYIKAIEYVDNFSDLKEYGSDIEFEITDEFFLVAFYAKSEQVVPKTEKTIDSKGNVIEKEMPLVKFNEIYQDYVCSCVLRIAREVFAVLPISKVKIIIFGSVFNSATGNQENCCILSVVVDKETMQKLNFNLVDPSDSMQNFFCQMNFDKKKGFQKIDYIDKKK